MRGRDCWFITASAVLVREEKSTQSPIYYVIKALSEAETTYPHLKKLALPLIMATQK